MFERWFRQQGFIRRSVSDETRDRILEEERQRIEAWAKASRLEERRIEVDAGCSGTELVGVALTIPVRQLVEKRLEITEAKRSDHVLDALFDDLTLSGELWAVTITPENIELRFAPKRATEVYDVALRRVEELLASSGSEPQEPQGPYR